MSLILKKFLNSSSNGPELLNEYLKIAENILYEDENIVIEIIDKIKQNIVDYAIKYSPIYNNLKYEYIYTKKDFFSTSKWYSTELSSIEMESFKTSGSTTGDSFSYKVWRKYISLIENKYQYGMILDEFGIDKNHISIVVLSQLPYNPKMSNDEFYILDSKKTSYAMHGHKSINSTRYFMNFDTYATEPTEWHRRFFETIDTLPQIDVILCNGSQLNVMCKYIKKLNYKNKLCRLLTQTGQMAIYDDFYFLKNNEYIDYFCDSMRCWDGGATFFTCKFETRHLMDNISWTYEANDSKLVSTDYFSMAAPFVNYWNGDLCKIDSKYKRCECGRLYRPFEMIENRPFKIKGSKKLQEIKSLISELSFKDSIVSVQFDALHANITLNNKITIEQQQTLESILDSYKIIYIKE